MLNFIKGAIIILTVVSITTLTADTGKKKMSRSTSLAAMGPSIDFAKNDAKRMKDSKDEIVKFIGCDTENECFRTLQDLDLGNPAHQLKAGFALVAEFVESPKKGIMIYRR